MKALRLLGLAGSMALSLLLLPGCWKKLSVLEEIEQRFGLKFPVSAQVEIVKHVPGSTTELTYIRVRLNQVGFDKLQTMAPFDEVVRNETGNPFFDKRDLFPGWMPEDIKGRGGMLRFKNQTMIYFFDIRKPEQIEGWLVVASS